MTMITWPVATAVTMVSLAFISAIYRYASNSMKVVSIKDYDEFVKKQGEDMEAMKEKCQAMNEKIERYNGSFKEYAAGIKPELQLIHSKVDLMREDSKALSDVFTKMFEKIPDPNHG